MITPNVRLEARKHFNCSNLDGAELENKGGQGTALSHWKKRVFQNEYMTGESPIIPIYSHLTTALFKDMGLYGVRDYHRISSLTWGKNMGCSFCNDSCLERPMNSEREGYGCNSSTPTYQCTFDMMGWGRCNMVLASTDPLMDKDCYFYQADTNTYCEYDTKILGLTLNAGEKHGPSSRCFHSSLLQVSKTISTFTKLPQPSYMKCYPTTCMSSTQLKVMIDNIWYDCPYDGGYIEAVGYGGQLECKPRAADIVCMNTSDFSPVWPVFTSISPLSGSSGIGNSGTLVTIRGENFFQLQPLRVEIGGEACINLVVIDDNTIAANIPNNSEYTSLTSFGVFSSRVSVVIRAWNNKSTVGKDVFHLITYPNGEDINPYFRSLGLARGLVIFLTFISLILCCGMCFLWIWMRARSEKEEQDQRKSENEQQNQGLSENQGI
eukprot:TRINITY_DN13547_c0_g1_i1.p1 TRINITY_DN13547_c0_g1~~TRINITY_DN13547_c0_g1_i1.p1  ORF type:complete len:436 (+),score=80.58 TRINITY_DN13547_c0_g1_i1:361-1668(+)